MGNSFYETRLQGIMVVLGLGVISRKTEGKDLVPTGMKLQSWTKVLGQIYI